MLRRASEGDPAALAAALGTPWSYQGAWGGSTLSRSLTYCGIQARTPAWTGVREGHEAFLHCGASTYIGAGQFPRFAEAYLARLRTQDEPLADFADRFDALLLEVAAFHDELPGLAPEEALPRYMRLHQESQPYSYVFGYGEEQVVDALVRERAHADGADVDALARAATAPESDGRASALIAGAALSPSTRRLVERVRRQARIRTERRALWNRVEVRAAPHVERAAIEAGVPRELAHGVTHEELALALAGEPMPRPDDLRARLGATFLAWRARPWLLTGGMHARVAASLREEKTVFDGTLRGVVGNPGRAQGRVRIVTTDAAGDAFQKGEILVSDMTSPELATACGRAAAIVTDRGGMLCHAAIISREFGIPCVLGTEMATRSLRDGDVVEVDADAGVVRLLARA